MVNSIMGMEHVRNWCRVLEWLNEHLWYDCTSQPSTPRTDVSAARMENWSFKTNKPQFEIYPLHWGCPSDLYTTLSMKTWNTTKYACWLPRCLTEQHMNWHWQTTLHNISSLMKKKKKKKKQKQFQESTVTGEETWVDLFALQTKKKLECNGNT